MWVIITGILFYAIGYHTGVPEGKKALVKQLTSELKKIGVLKNEGTVYIETFSGTISDRILARMNEINRLKTKTEDELQSERKELEDERTKQERKLKARELKVEEERIKVEEERIKQEDILKARELKVEEERIKVEEERIKVEEERIKQEDILKARELKVEEERIKVEEDKHSLTVEREELDVLMYNAEEDGTLDSMYKKMYATGIDICNKVSDEIKTEITMLGLQETEFIKQYQEDKTPQFKRLSKIIIGSFNTEVKMMLKDMKYSNRDKVKANIIKLYSTTNKKLNGVIMFAASETQYWNTLVKKKGEQDSYRFFSDYTIPTELLEIKLKQVDLTSAYLFQKEVEDDKRREELKIIREQAQEEKELKAELDKLEKEETHYAKQIKQFEQYALKALDDVQRLEYEGRIKELEQQLAGVQEAKVDVESKTFNNKAGYVYIISNEGSLGKGVVKIGVTRRLEPMERVKELSGASVPFEYAVNAFIFSQDAFSTETQLHQQFREYEVNKVNHQKEFFRVSLEQIEDYVKQEIDPTINFNMESHSEQYLETLRIMQEEEANTEVIF